MVHMQVFYKLLQILKNVSNIVIENIHIQGDTHS